MAEHITKADRKDFRHMHGEPEVPKYRRKRDKSRRRMLNRFCGGNEETPHVYTANKETFWGLKFVCVKCGRFPSYLWESIFEKIFRGGK